MCKSFIMQLQTMNPGGDRLSDAQCGVAHGEMALDTRRAASGAKE